MVALVRRTGTVRGWSPLAAGRVSSLPSSQALRSAGVSRTSLASRSSGARTGVVEVGGLRGVVAGDEGQVDEPLGVGVEPPPGGLASAAPAAGLRGERAVGPARAGRRPGTGRRCSPAASGWPGRRGGRPARASVIASASPSGISETSVTLRSSTSAGPDRLALAVGGLEDDPVGRLLDDQAGQDPAVGQGQDVRLVVVADRGAGVEDRAEQLLLAVLGADRREVGADPLPLALDPVAGGAGVGGAGLGEDGPAPAGVAVAARSARGSAAGGGPRRSWAAGRSSAGLARGPGRRGRCGRSRSPRS